MRVLALRKCADGTFLAKSVRRVLRFVRISVAERKVCKAKPQHTVKSLKPLPKRETNTVRCPFLFFDCVNGLENEG